MTNLEKKKSHLWMEEYKLAPSSHWGPKGLSSVKYSTVGIVRSHPMA